jgi:hypothetical protein
LKIGNTGDVPARASEAFRKPSANGITDCRYDNRDRRRGLLRRDNAGSSTSDDDVNLQANQFGGQRGKPLVLSLCEPSLEGNVSPLDITVFLQCQPKCVPQLDGSRVRRGRSPQKSDPPHLPHRLRLDDERSGEKHRTRASEKRAPVDH